MATLEEQLLLLQQRVAFLSGDSAPQVNKATVKLPAFWSDKPKLWFAQAEALFDISGIKADGTKYGYVLSVLDSKTATKVEDLISNPPAEGKYEKIKNELIKQLSESRAQEIKQLPSAEDPKTDGSVEQTTGTNQEKNCTHLLSSIQEAHTGSLVASAAGSGKHTHITHHTAQTGSSVVQTTGTREGESTTRALSAHLAKTGRLAASAAGTGEGIHTIQKHKTLAQPGNSVVSSTGTRAGTKTTFTGSSVVPSTGTHEDTYTHKRKTFMSQNLPPKEDPRSISSVAFCSSIPAPRQEGISSQPEDAFSEGWELPKRSGANRTNTRTQPTDADGQAKPKKWKVRKTRKERRLAASSKAASRPSSSQPSVSGTKTDVRSPLSYAAGGRKVPLTSDRAKEVKQRPNGNGQSSVKRALTKTTLPRGEYKRQRLHETKKVTRPSYTQASSTAFSVAVTCSSTGRISMDVSQQVLAGIQNRIFSDALVGKQIQPPKFKAKPVYTDGVLKLWCADDHTRTWLQRAVCEMELAPNIKLVVRNQSDICHRVRCGILIPDQQGLLEDARNIGRVLSFQNPEVEVAKWTLQNAVKQTAGWFLVVGVPEDHVPILMKAGRRLAFGVGTVYIKFQGRKGRFTDVPLGWDPSTATLKQELKLLPASEETNSLPDTPEQSRLMPATASPPAPTSVGQQGASMDAEDVSDSISGFLGNNFKSADMFELKLGDDEEGTSDGFPFVDY